MSKKQESDFEDLIYKLPFIAIIFILFGWFLDQAIMLWIGAAMFAILLLLLGTIIVLNRKTKARVQRIYESELREYLERFAHRNKKTKGIDLGGYKYDKKDLQIVLATLKNDHKKHIRYNDLLQVITKINDKEHEEFVRENTFTNKDSKNTLQSLTGTEFEELLAELFTAKGYKVQLNGKSGDQGADLILSKDGVRTTVQAKRYTKAVNNKAIQEAVAAKAVHDCSFAMVVTTSNFTKGAFENAKANGVHLIWGKELRKQLAETLDQTWI